MKNIFGKINGKNIYQFKISNEFLEVYILNYGGIIQKLIYNNKNVVLGFDKLEKYVEDNLYVGSFVGRNAGRISKAKFFLNNKLYNLEKNDNLKNNLHSGSKCTSKMIFDYNEINDYTLELSLNILNMEDYFPGNLKIVLLFELKNKSFTITIKAISDHDTIFNPTYHSYFNLDGDYRNNILKHKLFINSDFFLELNQESIPTGKIIKVNKAMDFNNQKFIYKNINDNYLLNQKGYDHPYILNNSDNNILLKSNFSNIKMKLNTNLPSVILYSGNFIPENYFGKESKNRCGLCLEPQYYPDFINQDFSHFILKKDLYYNHYISYSFDNIL